MGQPFDVSANIGFDGATYFCKRCGKAGYERATQVRGHLAMCPGTLMRKGVEPTTGYNQLQPVATEYNGGLSGGQPVVPVVVASQSNELVGNQLATRYAQLEERMVKVENHYTHVMGQINQPQSQYQPVNQDFFSQYKGVIIVGAVILFALMLSGQSKSCEASSDSRSNSLNNVGTKALSKLIDVGVTKGIGSLLK